MGRKIPDILTRKEQDYLLNQFNVRYITSQRNKTMIYLMLNVGLRLSETTSLKWQNINLMTGLLKVVEGKGSKDRTMYVNSKSIKMLSEWKERQFKEWGKTEIVFTTRTLNMINRNAVTKMVKTYAKKANIDKNITPHSLRHTFATDFYEDTKNLVLTRNILGHKSINTTQIYIQVLNSDLKKTMREFKN